MCVPLRLEAGGHCRTTHQKEIKKTPPSAITIKFSLLNDANRSTDYEITPRWGVVECHRKREKSGYFFPISW